ncbi:hypothetical protein M6D81_25385 [Paenibacillus sp. J5C_2022]|uniref:hypothetical protein n=1 Tax=Paenibacillus sp. J5C2022 TaxID=2977129 RepID=UPI0021CFD3BB|nr:hypothetical protein [Paenibacillus sp. J5C2022]MCU6712035.1 hypothetical protein [Paenibacillus sp. J5C2022]
MLGYNGTIEFDWNSEEAKVHMHNAPRVESCKVGSSHMSHGGGDAALADNFLRMMKGEGASGTSLADGLLSALMCVRAKQSAESHTFQPISWTTEQLQTK